MTSNIKERIRWIDNAKAIGMFPVFYSHFVELFWDKHSYLMAFEQQKIINSFLMSFYFMLSGFFAKPPRSFYKNFKRLFLRRIIPVFSFALLLLPIWIVYIYISDGVIDWSDVLKRMLGYIRGEPKLDMVTWFLVCLFTCEIIGSIVLPFLNSNISTFLFGIFMLFVGLIICKKIGIVVNITGIAKNTWYIHESIVALGFYLIGKATFSKISYLALNKKWLVWLLTVISLPALYYSINLQSDNNLIVDMVVSNHGDISSFVLASFAGTILIIGIGIIIPPSKPLKHIGQNTIILLGLNGIFLHFVNNILVDLFIPSDNWATSTVYVSFIVICSLFLCFPFIQLINKYLPQLFGRSNKSGPILPNLEDLNWMGYILNKVQFVEKIIKKPISYIGNKLK